jgi:outer membrane lipoprotein carrier protein
MKSRIRSLLLPPLLLAPLACGGREAADGPGDAAAGMALPASQTVSGPGAPPPAPLGTDPAVPVEPHDQLSAPPLGPPVAVPPGAAPAPVTPLPGPASRGPSAPAAGATESEESAVAILARAERAWNAVRSMEADFTQRLSVPLMGTEQRSRGKMYHRRPDRFAMRFSDPQGDLLVADGRYFWMYYPSADRTQVMRSSAAAGGGQVDLQQEFLSNPTARYHVVRSGQEAVGGRPADVLTLTPKAASPYRQLRVWVDRGDALVRRFEMTEDNESVRRVELANTRINANVPDAVFRFTPPAGTQVFDQ